MTSAYRARDEEALQSRRRTDQRTTSKDARSETPQCAKGRSSSQILRRNDPKVARLARELNEALERQTATSEVLNVIAGSAGRLDPVFNAILRERAGICQAKFGTLNLYDGTAYRPLRYTMRRTALQRLRLADRSALIQKVDWPKSHEQADHPNRRHSDAATLHRRATKPSLNLRKWLALARC